MPTPDELNDCGPLALRAVAAHHGLELDLDRARKLCGTKPVVGTNLVQLQRAAEKLGFTAKAAKGDFAALSKCPLPLIAHVEITERVAARDGTPETHSVSQFVVVEEIGERDLEIVEVAGRRRVSHDEFRSVWTGKLLLLVPSKRFRAP